MEQYFKHTLPSQEIVVRQDAGSQSNDIEYTSGQFYPLIRIKDKLVEINDIVGFSINAGIDTFFPTLNISIDDAQKIQRESNFIEDNDIITIFVGNSQDIDHEVIKNDYYILDAPSSDTSHIISLQCILHVPKLWEGSNRVFNDTSFNVFKAIAQECGLGFVSNISNTNDEMMWIQHQSNYDFIKWLETRAFVSITTSLKVYIDQFANLVLMDVKKALDSKEIVQLTRMPISGELLETPADCIATNNTQGTEEPRVQLTTWSPVNNFGEFAINYANNFEIETINCQSRESTIVSSTSIKKQLRHKSKLTALDNEHLHTNYHVSRMSNYQNAQLLQSTKLIARTRFYMTPLFIGMNLPVEIWNLQKNEERNSQDSTIDNESIEYVEATGNGSSSYSINNTYTGNYLLSSIQIVYSRNARTTDKSGVQQSLELIQKQ